MIEPLLEVIWYSAEYDEIFVTYSSDRMIVMLRNSPTIAVLDAAVVTFSEVIE